jgi:lysophospholipase L1-like esterase
MFGMHLRWAKVLFVLATVTTLLDAGVVSGAEVVTKGKRIVYIEASTGRAWKLDQFANRTGVTNLSIQFVPVYDFDKSAVVAKVLEPSTANPDIVVLQECSAYFPGPLEDYKKMYHGWIQQIKRAGVVPVVATTVPPAERSGLLSSAKEFIKIHILGRESQHDQIAAFNDWLRWEAKHEGLRVLDLEESLRRSGTDRRMNDAYDAGDGTHLNEKAYQLLDSQFARLLKEMDSGFPR